MSASSNEIYYFFGTNYLAKFLESFLIFLLQFHFCKYHHRRVALNLFQADKYDRFVCPIHIHRVKFLLHQKVLTFYLNNCSRIDGNSISGKIPSFIKNWQSVNRMLVHSDIKHLMTFSWSESERPSFTQISILTLSLHFPAICRVHRWVVLFLQKFPCWRTWQNCMRPFTCCIMVLSHFFYLVLEFGT